MRIQSAEGDDPPPPESTNQHQRGVDGRANALLSDLRIALDESLTESDPLAQAESAALEHANSLASADAVLGTAMLEQAASSETAELRRWAAIALVDVQTPKDVYLKVSMVLARDPEMSVRQATLESVVFGTPRRDVTWAEIQPIVQFTQGL